MKRSISIGFLRILSLVFSLVVIARVGFLILNPAYTDEAAIWRTIGYIVLFVLVAVFTYIGTSVDGVSTYYVKWDVTTHDGCCYLRDFDQEAREAVERGECEIVSDFIPKDPEYKYKYSRSPKYIPYSAGSCLGMGLFFVGIRIFGQPQLLVDFIIAGAFAFVMVFLPFGFACKKSFL